jgi:hypothetical protein
MAGTDDHDNNWTPFRDKVIERASRLPIVDPTARWQEAEQLTLKQLYSGGDLEILWRDVDGREHVGMPFDVWDPVYDSKADCLRERLPGGRALYQPLVRRKLNKATDNVVEPAVDNQGELEPTGGSNQSTGESAKPSALTMIRGEHKREDLEPIAREVFPPDGKPPLDMPTNQAVKIFSDELKNRGILIDKPQPNISIPTLERVLDRRQ